MKRIGISSLQREHEDAQSYSTLSENLTQAQTASLRAQLAHLQQTIGSLADSHREQIMASPLLRQHLAELCMELGIDPAGGEPKSLWTRLGASDWYSALGIQTIDACDRLRPTYGGLLDLDDVVSVVNEMRSAHKASVSPVDAKDVEHAVKGLAVLGSGFRVLNAHGRRLLQCVPGEFDHDVRLVFEAIDGGGCAEPGSVSADELLAFAAARALPWARERALRVLDHAAARDGILWCDAVSMRYYMATRYDLGF